VRAEEAIVDQSRNNSAWNCDRPTLRHHLDV